MMGVSVDEVDKVLQSAKADLRIAGFDEEENRMRQRMSYRPPTSLKLPQGPYTFSDFRTLQIPGVEVHFSMQIIFYHMQNQAKISAK
uniref:Uncharacterized protein LOC107417406 n=1 Tax=Rhizophora mucronata TaxID=61149 RepID=A0A2P2L036_RHIMU